MTDAECEPGTGTLEVDALSLGATVAEPLLLTLLLLLMETEEVPVALLLELDDELAEELRDPDGSALELPLGESVVEGATGGLALADGVNELESVQVALVVMCGEAALEDDGAPVAEDVALMLGVGAAHNAYTELSALPKYKVPSDPIDTEDVIAPPALNVNRRLLPFNAYST